RRAMLAARLRELLDVFLQRDGIVVFSVLRAEQQCDSPSSGLLRELLDLLTPRLQFCSVSHFEFYLACRIMPEPFSQGGARRDLFKPFINSRFAFLQAPWPDAID